MKIEIGQKKHDFLSEKMFGLFFEDINYAADGGLYGEMLENRQFAFRKAFQGVAEKTYETVYAGNYGWEKSERGSAAGMTFHQGDALSEANPHFMRFEVERGQASFTNKAYDGICMEEGKRYHCTLWLRGEFRGEVRIQAKKAEGALVAEGILSVTPSSEWKQYRVSLEAGETIKNGIFAISQSEGTLDYGYISLMPESAVAGVFREDLFEMLKELQPGFLRFPGGCIVEGANLANRYRWKDTIGQPWDRKWNWNRWAVHDVTMGQGEPKFFPYINQSYGIGFYEYFLLSELLGAKPLPVLSVGLACQFQSDELVRVEDPAFREYLQDALDLIEFANGDVTTKWGAMRAKMGHPERFGLEYIGIGNEQWETERADFFERYQRFEEAVHEVYPEIQLLGSAGPDVGTERYRRAWEFYRREGAKKQDFTAAVDEHYYMPPAWFYENVNMYDAFPRDIPVFAGEYAAHGEGKKNNWEAGLAEAAFLCGLEKNGDVIRFASAAPLFARKGYEQWVPDYIWFDGDTVMGTPGYYVQKLFGAYTGNCALEYSIQEGSDELYSAVSEKNGTLYVKLINAGTKSLRVEEITWEGKKLSPEEAKVLWMSGESLDVENVLGGETAVELLEVAEGDKSEIPPLSCCVMVFPSGRS